MASFETKMQRFLGAAVEHKVVPQTDADKLLAFAHSGDYEHKGWLSLSAAMGGLGALALIFGIILIIATNWYRIGDVTKLAGFLALLGGSHFAGLYVAKKGYFKMAMGLHLLGAGLFIAGIGLIAQIFHLHSDKGVSFLLWAAMIAPLAVLLRSGSIALLVVVAFAILGTVYIDYMASYRGYIAIFVFQAATALAATLGGWLLHRRGSAMAVFLWAPGMVGVMGWLYFFGFTHGFHARDFDILGKSWVPLVPIVIVMALWVAGWMQYAHAKAARNFLLGMAVAALPLAMLLLPAELMPFKGVAFERWAFGWTKKVYVWPLFISVSAWVGYFGLAFWGVIQGALQHRRGLLNSSVFLIGVGIFTRFIDLMGSMMDTGMLFVACGILLFAIGFGLEKWRRKLIAQANAEGGE